MSWASTDTSYWYLAPKSVGEKWRPDVRVLVLAAVFGLCYGLVAARIWFAEGSEGLELVEEWFRFQASSKHVLGLEEYCGGEGDG